MYRNRETLLESPRHRRTNIDRQPTSIGWGSPFSNTHVKHAGLITRVTSIRRPFFQAKPAHSAVNRFPSLHILTWGLRWLVRTSKCPRPCFGPRSLDAAKTHGWFRARVHRLRQQPCKVEGATRAGAKLALGAKDATRNKGHRY